jgi:hypothetical protein
MFAYGWAPGGKPHFFPEEAGMSLGTHGYKSFELETHYDNPELVHDRRDSSGVRFYYTEQKRQHEVGVIVFGDANVGLRRQEMPPGVSQFTFSCPDPFFLCPVDKTKGLCAQCKAAEPCFTLGCQDGVLRTDGDFSKCAGARQCVGCFPDSPCGHRRPGNVTVFMSGLHMHETGAKILTTQRRRSGSTQVVNEIDFWKFNFQDMTRTKYTMMDGDSYNTSCYYDNKGKRTKWGLGSRDEMCQDFVFYYPKTSCSPGACGFEAGGQLAIQKTLANAEALGRSFGKPTAQCPSSTTAKTPPTEGSTPPTEGKPVVTSPAAAVLNNLVFGCLCGLFVLSA